MGSLEHRIRDSSILAKMNNISSGVNLKREKESLRSGTYYVKI